MSHQSSVAHRLAKHGPTTMKVLSAELKLSPHTVATICNHPWFRLEPHGVVLTERGQRELAAAEPGIVIVSQDAPAAKDVQHVVKFDEQGKPRVDSQ